MQANPHLWTRAFQDEPRGIVRDAGKSNYRFSALIMSIVKSTPFQMKQAQAANTVADARTRP